jgi:hypothetical protein
VTPAGKEQGTCLGLCGEGKPACPSWQECVVVDPSQGLSACFVIAAYDDPCSPADGVLCDASRLEYCIAPPADGQARCTRFCDDGPEGPSCPPWQECLATSASASACFRKPPCEGGGCVPVLSPAGAECAPEAGVSCGPGLECVAGAGGWVGHCAAPCATGEDCGAFTVCVDGLCRRADRLIPGAVPCGPAFGCEPGDGGGAAACTPVGPDLSVCLPACDPGPCPAGTACVGGGCAVVSGLGGPCGPDRGLLCAEGLACRIDESLDHHFGHCTRPCGEGCPEGFQCVEGRCGRTAGYGGSCSGVAGTFCDPADPGLVCKVLRPGTRSGFCTASCQIGQSCPDPGGDLAATCMLVASPGWLCALTCGDLGGTCPPHLQCGTFGVCL